MRIMKYLVYGCFENNDTEYIYTSNLALKPQNGYTIMNENNYDYRGSIFKVNKVEAIARNTQNPLAKRSIVKAKNVNLDNTANAISHKSSPVKNIWFNDSKKITVVQWLDGSKTKVQCQGDDTYSRESGFAMCALKKLYGSYSMDKDMKKYEIY